MIELPFNSNPLSILMEIGTPYEEYCDNIIDTFNFKYYSKFIYEAKSIDWDISAEHIVKNQIRIIYASILELMIEDNTPEMFYNIFPEYVKKVFNRNDNQIYRDGNMNSIFHYDAVQGIGREDAYLKIQNLHNKDTQNEIGIISELLEQSLLLDENAQGVRVIDVINGNIKS